MTKRVTVSLPDDVAAYLEARSNTSAAVTDALRAHMNRAAAIATMLRIAGYKLTEDGIERARGQLPPLTPEQRAEGRRRLDEIQAGT